MSDQDHAEKTFLVTGANSGIGLETAKGLAQTGGTVVMTARDREKGERALEVVRRATGNERLRLLMLDLASLDSVAAAAEQVDATCDRLDVLVNNAGLGTTSGGETADGIELVFGTNHVGPFALTEALLPKLLDTADRYGEARVVNVSSAAHAFARGLDPAEVPRRDANGWVRYGDSKMANLLHARELAARYGERGLHAHAVHPGFVASGFGRQAHYPGAWQLVFKLTRPFQVGPETGAEASLHCALSEEAGRKNGLYWTRDGEKEAHLPRDAGAIQRRLWDRTRGLIDSARASA